MPLGSAADFYRLVNGAGDEIVARPGERFFYHNAAWRMLGAIIQVKSGVPFHQYMKANVIDPLGMQRTTLSLTAFQADPDHILPHLKVGDEVEASRFPYPNPDDNLEFSFITAAGGIVSSVNEMTRYLNAQIDKGQTEGGRLASEQSFEKMQQLHIHRPDGYYGEYGYGYGLGITPDFLRSRDDRPRRLDRGVDRLHGLRPRSEGGCRHDGQQLGDGLRDDRRVGARDPHGEGPGRGDSGASYIRERMKRLMGSYEVYRGLERLKVVSRGGLLYLEADEPQD